MKKIKHLLPVMVFVYLLVVTSGCNKSIRTVSYPCTYFEIGNKNSQKLKKERREDHAKYMSSVESQTKQNRKNYR